MSTVELPDAATRAYVARELDGVLATMHAELDHRLHELEAQLRLERQVGDADLHERIDGVHGRTLRAMTVLLQRRRS